MTSRRVLVGAVGLVALLGLPVTLGGCGSNDPQIPTAPSPTVTKQANFPLRVVRQGGVAGFNDQLYIQDDGGVVASTKRGQVTCTLDKGSLAVLNDAAARIPTDLPPVTTTGSADAMEVLLGSHFSDLVPVENPRVAKAEPVVTQLLADVTGKASDRKICT